MLSDQFTQIQCKLHVEKLDHTVGLAALSTAISKLNCPAVLGGSDCEYDLDLFSYWAAEPIEIFKFTKDQKKPFDALKKVLNKYQLIKKPASELPEGIFTCGWLGFFSYDLNFYTENIKPHATDDINLPLIRLCFYDRVIAYDHTNKLFYLIVIELPGESETPASKLRQLKGIMDSAESIKIQIPQKNELSNITLNDFKMNMSRQYYLDAFAKIKKYILDGDVYQINFSQRFETDFTAEPVELFNWQNYHNPAPYSAFISTDAFSIVSTSPELFIKIQDNFITTRPIKGTRPRINPDSEKHHKINMENYDQLLKSSKEKAELNMIIDLERNDIARISVPGTRTVSMPRNIKPFATVFHAEAEIKATLPQNRSLADILPAVFPGGSITGAPKIRSMQIINELEPTARNLYTGSIGFIGLDGNVCLNIAIRTGIIKGAKAFVQTGGAIVADSEPDAEWDETITKAKALLAGITAVQKK